MTALPIEAQLAIIEACELKLSLGQPLEPLEVAFLCERARTCLQTQAALEDLRLLYKK